MKYAFKRTLGELESQFFAYVQAEGLTTVRTGDLSLALGWDPIQERKLLSRLSQAGLVARVRRGLYLAPPRLPLGGKWSPGVHLALTTLTADRNARYQICGPNAFNHYGWDDQVPNRFYVYNNRISGDHNIGLINLTLIRVADQRLGGTETLETPEGVEVVYSSRARSLMDAVYDWDRFNSLPRGYDWIRSELEQNDSLAAELVDVSLRFGNQGTLRRIGRLMEMEGSQPLLLRRLEKALRRSRSPIPWVPGRPRRGVVDKRWGVVVNDES